MSNSRRRLLGLMGLIGLLPVSAWAQTSSDSTSITCSAATDTPTYELRYTNTFDLQAGRLVSSSGDALMNVDAAPVSQTFFPPFKDGATPGAASIIDTLHPLMNLDLNSTVGGGVSFHANIITPTVTAEGVAQMRDASGALLGEVDLEAEAQTGDIFNQTLSGYFDGAVVPSILAGPVEITVMIDDQVAAKYTYDVSEISWKPYMTQKDTEFAKATGVTKDASGATNVEGCNSGCFFTTAASLTLGLSDDCWELRTLRRFRDGPLATTADGRALIARYYLEAPGLVTAIDRRPDATTAWLRSYWSHVLPCAVLARLGLNRLAIAHYTHLFANLQRLAAA